MPASTRATKVFDREFLGMRCRLIELAATLDRIDRAEGAVADDPRRSQIRRALEILLTDTPDRAERVELAFSLPYEDEKGIRDWGLDMN
jgi:hypothetical protein